MKIKKTLFIISLIYGVFRFSHIKTRSDISIFCYDQYKRSKVSIEPLPLLIAPENLEIDFSSDVVKKEPSECLVSFKKINSEDLDSDIKLRLIHEKCRKYDLRLLKNILDNECKIIKYILYPSFARRIKYIKRRDKLQGQLNPYIKNIYNDILDFATHNKNLKAKFSRSNPIENKKLKLSINDEKLFLHTVYRRIKETIIFIKKIL